MVADYQGGGHQGGMKTYFYIKHLVRIFERTP
jgi:hypothetical protein